MLSDRCLSVCLSCPVLSVTLVYCGQTVRQIKMKLGTHVGLGPGHIVLDGDSAPHPPKGHSPPPFSAHICCGKMAARTKMSVGMALGLGPGDFVLDRDPVAPPQKGDPQIFGPCLLWPNGWMDQDATCRDAKSPVSGGRLPYLDVHYGLPCGRAYLTFSPFTYGASGGDRHTHAGKAAVLLQGRQVHPCLLIYAVLAQTHDARDVARL